MTRRAYNWLLAFALLGLGASSSSTWVHYNLLKDPSYTSVCDVSAHVSCTQAYLSPWGSLFGTPVAIFGVLFFVFITGLILAGRRGSPLHENLAAYVSLLSTIGLAFVLYLAYGAFFVLKEVCIFCLATYVAVIGLFAVSTAQSQVSMSRLPQRLARDLRAALSSPLGLAALLVFAVAAASAIAFFPKEAALPADLTTSSTQATPAQGAQGAQPAAPQDQRTELERWWDAQPRTIVPVGDTGGAAVVIVKFNDFQCPPCRNTYYAYKPILEKYQAEAPGKVLFLLKDFPLDPECNENAPGGAHLAACEAAAAIRLARAENKPIEKLEEYFYSNQQTLTTAAVKQAVKDLDGITDFDAKYPSMLQQVKTDIALGKLLGVGSTPTFFINGVKFPGGIQPQHLDAIIAYELKKAAK